MRPAVLVFFLLFALGVLPAAVRAIDVNSCQDIAASGVYQVTQNLAVNGANCLTISANDVDLNCQGFRVSGNLASNTFGIRTTGTRNNVTVHNCVVATFGNGIGIGSTTNSNVSYNTVANLTDNGAQGINFGNSNFSYVAFNTISNVSTTPGGAIAAGIFGGSSNNSRILSNTVQNFPSNGARGIIVDTVANSRNHTVSGNTVQNLNDTGIETHGFNVTVSSNTVLNITGNGVYQEGNDSLVTANTLANNTRGFSIGIVVESGHANINVTSNTITTTSRGIDFRSNSSLIAHNVVSNITAVQEGGVGVGSGGVTGTTGNTIYNNTVRDSQPAVALGVAISTSGINYNASYNVVSNWNGSGISIDGDNGRLSSNTVTGVNGINAWALQYRGQFGIISSNTVANMTGTTVNGFFTPNLSHSTFTQNIFRNFTGASSVATSIGQDPAVSQNVTVFSNTVTDVNGTGLGAYGNTFNMSYNTITGASGSINGHSFIYSGEFGIIQSNTVANITASGNIAIRTFNINHTRILSNVVDNFNLQSTGIQIEDETRSRNNTVSSNTVRNFNGTGLNIFSNNATVSLNTLTNLTANNANGIFYQGLNGTVTLNTIANSTSTFFAGISTSASVADNVNITFNTLTNLTARGIDFRGNNSLIAHNTFSLFSGIGVSYISVIEVVWTGIQNDTVYNNTISNSMTGVALNPGITVSGRSMNASYNTVQQYNGTAFDMGSSNNSFALWNTILNFSNGDGFRVGQFSNNTVIAFNTIANASGAAQTPSTGVQLNGLNNNFSYNNVTNINTTTLVFNGGSSGIRLQNNLFSNGRGNGVQFNTGANDNWVVDNQILNFTGFAVSTVSSNRNVFSGNLINQTFTGVGDVLYFENANHSRLIDNRIASNGSDNRNDLVATSAANNNTFLNSTFNFSRINWQDANSNVTIQYYLTVNVTNGISGQPISNAAVDVRNRNSTTLLTGLLTNATGLTTQNLTVLFINSTGITNHTPHNVSVSRLGWSNSSNFTMSDNTNAVVMLSSACTTLFTSATLLNDVSINGATCITLGADNLVLDLGGFTVTGNKTLNRYGVLASGRTNVNVSSGRVQGFHNGVLFSATNRSLVFNVTFFNHTIALEGFDVNNSNFSYNNASYSDQHGIGLTNSFNLTVQNNTIQDNGLAGQTFAGVSLLRSNSSTVSLNYWLRNSLGAFFNGTTGNIIQGGSILNSSSRALLFSDGSGSNVVSGVTLSGNYSNSSYRDVASQNASANTLHDLSFNKSSVVFDTSASNFTVNYTMYVNVTNSTSALANAQVNFTPVGGSVARSSVLTNSTGFTVQNVTEYVQSGSQVYGTNETTSNPYTVLVSLAGYTSNSSSATVTQARQLNILLSVPQAAVPSSTGGSSATPTPIPIPAPTPAPAAATPTPAPSVSPESTPDVNPPALDAPSQIPTFVLDQQVGVDIETGAAGDDSDPGANQVLLNVRKELFVEKVPTSISPFGVLSTVRMTFSPVGHALENFRFTQNFGDVVPYLGPTIQAYKDAGFIFSHKDRIVEPILEGSAVVTWLFDNVEPGQETQVQVQVPGEVTPDQVGQIKPPKVIARSAKTTAATATPTLAAATPAGFDWTLVALGSLVLAIGAGAYWFTKRQ